MKTAIEHLVEQLKEQIHKSLNNELGTQRTGDYRIGLTKAIELAEQAKQLEKEQADNFAIEFAEWCTINYPNQRKFLLKQGNLKGFYTTKELLEIYKKEKEL